MKKEYIVEHLGYPVRFFQGTTMRHIDDALAKEENEDVVVFAITDDDAPSRHAGRVSIFRTSVSTDPREHGLPYVFEPMEAMDPLSRGVVPRIGFCGSMHTHPSRVHLIRLLERVSPYVARMDFLCRRDFWGGKPHDPSIVEDFRANMERSEFALCPRGTGNFSMRLYQAMSAGRIPIVVGDHCLPWPEDVPWPDLCVLARTAEDVVPRVFEFWGSRDIEAAQRACRDAYAEHFTGQGFLDLVRKRIIFSSSSAPSSALLLSPALLRAPSLALSLAPSLAKTRTAGPCTSTAS